MSGSSVTITGTGSADIQALVGRLVDRVAGQSAAGGSPGASPSAPIIASVTIRG